MFQFLMVRLKVSFPGLISFLPNVSIPYGTIKRLRAAGLNPYLALFQFLMVRLKVIISRFSCKYSVFQFLMVRLKARCCAQLYLNYLKFQFLMVRLKDLSQKNVFSAKMFQFLMVRLKDLSNVFLFLFGLFQFLMVRLKAAWRA